LKRKLQYVAGVAALGAAVCGPLLWFGAPLWSWLAAAVVFLVPGRIAGHYYRDLFTGRRLMDAGQFAEAIPHFELFLQRIRIQPGLKQLTWLSPGVYTQDVEAMALNNLGAARLEFGELDKVEAPLRQALALDPDYPIPYVNLAHLAVLRGDLKAATAASNAANSLGYRDSKVDAMIHRASSYFAGVEGRFRRSQ
jgi:tetratricopeptide (TPR) repeat protein